MSVRGPQAVLRSVPHSIAGEWIWGGLGVGFAVASASFAGYMILVGPADQGSGGSDFGVFAQFDRRAKFADAQPSVQRADERARPGDAEPDRNAAVASWSKGIDFAPTGSVDLQQASADAASGPQARAGRPDSLPGFVLRDVFDGKALVEARSRLVLVRPGSILDGAGEVRSIERQGPNWVVVTAAGLIAAEAR